MDVVGGSLTYTRTARRLPLVVFTGRRINVASDRHLVTYHEFL